MERRFELSRRYASESLDQHDGEHIALDRLRSKAVKVDVLETRLNEGGGNVDGQ